MKEFALIADVAVIWAVSLLSGHLCIRFKQPVIAGYMLAGMAVGPHALGLINQPEQINVLAEFGVAMLLFALGVDLSLKQVFSSARRLITAGLCQMLLTIIVSWILADYFGLASNPASGLLFGSICAISSSVVISRVLIDRGEIDSIHGQVLIPLSLVQDLSLLVIIPFIPVLQNGLGDISALFLSLAKAVAFILL
ncbi:MAG: cation:proton antiporter, partial [Candidatus Obscuribacterales bacterium]|nr:cation:proton antiporter [Candidatus Obscuribacterales bacterium]